MVLYTKAFLSTFKERLTESQDAMGNYITRLNFVCAGKVWVGSVSFLNPKG
jgi:hypothetical protein